jgi:AcrR family transcriptional regulator
MKKNSGASLNAAPADISRAPAASRHEELLDVAARHLNANGVSLTSLADIAATLGVSRAALYYYVEDRNDLVFQCYRRSCEIMARHLGEAIHTGGDARTVVGNFVSRMLDPQEPEIAARAEIAFLNPTQHETIQGLYDAITSRLAHVLKEAAAAGQVRECDFDINARVILSLVTWAPLARPWGPGLETLTRDRMIAAVTGLLLEGFTGERATLPSYRTIDLASLQMPIAGVFDREALGDAKREALLAAASRLFNRKGIDSTSLDEIAETIGATKRSLYRYLGSKQVLVAACYDRAFRIFFHVMDSMVAYNGSRLDAIASAFHAVPLAYLREDLSPLSPLIGFFALSRRTRKKFTENSVRLTTGYRDAVLAGVAEGSLPQQDVEARLMMVPGAFSWLVKDDVPSAPVDRDRIAREISNLLTVGLNKK